MVQLNSVTQQGRTSAYLNKRSRQVQSVHIP